MKLNDVAGAARTTAVLLFVIFAASILPETVVGQAKAVKRKTPTRPEMKIAGRRGVRTTSAPARRQTKVIVKTTRPVIASEFSGDVRDLPSVITEVERRRFETARPAIELKGPEIEKKVVPDFKPEPTRPTVPLAPMPTPLISVEGMNRLANGTGFPPDTDGDIGYQHYIQAVNTSFRILDKSGATISTATIASLWTGAGTGTPCDTAHNGDPTVVFDPASGRFILGDFSWTNLQNGPYYECIAVSKTSNPVTGGWWLYAVRGDDPAKPYLPDYPKMGVWRDTLFMGVNMFDCLNADCSSATYQGVRAYAMNLAKMRNGTALTASDVQVADLPTSRFSAFPATYRGTPPPVGRPGFFVAESTSVFGFEVFQYNPDFAVPANSTFTGPTNISHSSYGFPTTAPVPAPGTAVDTLIDRIMKQVQYRNISGTESLWVTHTTGPPGGGTVANIHWAQINITGGVVNTTLVQQQFFNNGSDGLHRYMPSLAVDKQGNMAVGYSASNSATAPDIRYAGRLAGDPAGTLPQTETTMLPGVARGVQVGIDRWGDYSSMSVDPVDDCTFWYTHQYYAVNGNDWRTRTGTFKFPTCLGPTASYAAIGGLVKSQNGNGIGGAIVSITNANGETRTARTSSLGYFSIGGLEVGQTHTISVNSKRFSFDTRVVSLTDSIDDLEIIAN